jgi:perosamine synthetase
MTNLTAALGTAQLERWDELVGGRVEVERLYDTHLGGGPTGRRPRAPWATPSCWLYCLTTRRRGDLLRLAGSSGVDARAVWPALSDLPFYRSYCPRPCPNASAASASAVWLPTWSHMTADEVRQVAALLQLGG